MGLSIQTVDPNDSGNSDNSDNLHSSDNSDKCDHYDNSANPYNSENLNNSDYKNTSLANDRVDVKTAREILGPEKIIGVTACSVEEALRGVQKGANYLGIGTMFATPT